MVGALCRSETRRQPTWSEGAISTRPPALPELQGKSNSRTVDRNHAARDAGATVGEETIDIMRIIKAQRGALLFMACSTDPVYGV